VRTTIPEWEGEGKRKREQTLLWTTDVKEGVEVWKLTKLSHLEDMIVYVESIKHFKLLDAICLIRESFIENIRSGIDIKSFW